MFCSTVLVVPFSEMRQQGYFVRGGRHHDITKIQYFHSHIIQELDKLLMHVMKQYFKYFIMLDELYSTVLQDIIQHKYRHVGFFKCLIA